MGCYSIGGDGRTLVAVGVNGSLLRSRDAGESWEARPSRTGSNMGGITALADGRTLVAVGAGGTVLRSQDAGENWEVRPTETFEELKGVVALADGRTLVAVGARVAPCCAAETRAKAGRDGQAGLFATCGASRRYWTDADRGGSSWHRVA